MFGSVYCNRPTQPIGGVGLIKGFRDIVMTVTLEHGRLRTTTTMGYFETRHHFVKEMAHP